MQKLVWQNANGEEIDLTKDPFGITKWEGFSNTGLNIQTQTVPFSDGAVYLDALLNQRELSVTLAINDENDLYKRYELKRKLIAVLNPKMGEGYLIYTNDYLSKRIKCVAQLPVFPTKNSDTKGTQKASLTWVACEPYWEDIEETEITIDEGGSVLIENVGDIPTPIKVELFNYDSINPELKNLTQNKKVELNGTFSKKVFIDTNMGEKKIYEEEMSIDNIISSRIIGISYSPSLNLYLKSCENLLLKSSDAKKWRYVKTSELGITNVYNIIWIEDKQIFIGTATDTSDNTGVATSEDGETWSFQQLEYIDKFVWSHELQKLIGLNSTKIWETTDFSTWDSTEFASYRLRDIVWAKGFSKFYVVGNQGNTGKLLTSSDGTNWIEAQSPIEDSYSFNSICYNDKENNILIGASLYSQGGIYLSSDGTVFTKVTDIISPEQFEANSFGITVKWNSFLREYEVVVKIMSYHSQEGTLVYKSKNGNIWEKTSTELLFSDLYYFHDYGEWLLFGDEIVKSYDLKNFELLINLVGANYSSYLKNIIYSKSIKKYLAFFDGVIYASKDLKNWEKVDINASASASISANELVTIISSYRQIEGQQVYGVSVTNDGDTWDFNAIDDCYSVNSLQWLEDKGFFIGCAVRKSDSTKSYILTSVDGRNWVKTNGNKSFKSVEYNNFTGNFILGKISSMSLYDKLYVGKELTDIDNFEEVSLAYTDYKYIPEKNISVAFLRDNSSVIYQSIDDKTWCTVKTIDKRISDFEYYSLENMYYFATANGLLKTFDLINFKNVNSESYQSVLTSMNKLFLSKSYNVVFMLTFEKKINIINKLSSDSDLGICLQKGENQIMLSVDSGDVTALITYRQKYIGV